MSLAVFSVAIPLPAPVSLPVASVRRLTPPGCYPLTVLLQLFSARVRFVVANIYTLMARITFFSRGNSNGGGAISSSQPRAHLVLRLA